jgi:hypothetical protein
MNCSVVLSLLILAGRAGAGQGLPGGKPGVEVRLINYKGWEQAVELQNDTVRVVVVPSIGRIMHYSFLDGENLLYTNPEMYGQQLVPGEVFMKDGKAANVMFGGDRLVTLPEHLLDRVLSNRINTDPWIDGRAWEMKLINDGVCIESPVSQLFGVQLTRWIRLEPQGTKVRIDQRMIRIQLPETAGVEQIPLTIWNLTQIPPPEQTWQPLATNSSLENGIYVPPFSKKSVLGNYVIQDGMIQLTPNKQRSQKIGTDSRGWVAGLIGKTLMIERFDFIEGATYPDWGTSTAVYTNPMLAELECLSPQKVLAIGDSIEHTIWWELHAAEDEQAAVTILKNL